MRDGRVLAMAGLRGHERGWHRRRLRNCAVRRQRADGRLRTDGRGSIAVPGIHACGDAARVVGNLAWRCAMAPWRVLPCTPFMVFG